MRLMATLIWRLAVSAYTFVFFFLQFQIIYVYAVKAFCMRTDWLCLANAKLHWETGLASLHVNDRRLHFRRQTQCSIHSLHFSANYSSLNATSTCGDIQSLTDLSCLGTNAELRLDDCCLGGGAWQTVKCKTKICKNRLVSWIKNKPLINKK